MKMMTFHILLFSTTAVLASIAQSKYDTLGKVEDLVDGLPIVGGLLANAVSMLK